MEEFFDNRLRGYYRARYECRKNLMDSDYNWSIKPVSPIIHWQHFKEWRHTGIAFESRLGSYNRPNRTLAAYIDGSKKKDGSACLVRGYWGDIVNSPYWSFGTRTVNVHDKQRLFKKASEQFRHTETDVSEFNVEAWVRECENYKEFNLPPAREGEDVFPYEKSAMDDVVRGCVVEEVQEEGSEEPPPSPLLDAFGDVKIVPLIGTDLQALLKKPRYRGLFHRAYFANMHTLPLLEDAKDKDKCPSDSHSSPLQTSLNENACTVTIETMRSQVALSGTMKIAFRVRMLEAMRKLGFQPGAGELSGGDSRLEGVDMENLKDYDARQWDAEMGDYMTFRRESGNSN